MMDDLIWRAAAIEAFDDERVDRNYGDVSPESVIRVIESIPAVDAVPVIRCKDCMYWKSNTLTHFWKPCDIVSTDKDWYCPCGKRR